MRDADGPLPRTPRRGLLGATNLLDYNISNEEILQPNLRRPKPSESPWLRDLWQAEAAGWDTMREHNVFFNDHIILNAFNIYEYKKKKTYAFL